MPRRKSNPLKQNNPADSGKWGHLFPDTLARFVKGKGREPKVPHTSKLPRELRRGQIHSTEMLASFLDETVNQLRAQQKKNPSPKLKARILELEGDLKKAKYQLSMLKKESAN